ncbi:hypothetical protein PG993_007037 [Apiospora rasikravindrae]|uniref:Carrier domain-containing protein n=1 Tax=Apiospora rasikravindrae TaxID=990691 RepID=A0ABR1SWE3_9PEZI
MHIGPIFGAGYITQQQLDLGYKEASDLKSMFPISEQDFLQHFAEAVMCQHSSSRSSSVELASGLTKFASPEEAGNAFLSHFTQVRATSASDASSGKTKASLKSQLEVVRDHSQLTHIVREAFLSKLSVLFQIELCKLEQAELKAMRLEEMGIDSLIAVEIRSWFVKMLQVNVPVLKILSGSTVFDIIEFAVDTMPRALVPKLNAETSDARATDQQQTSLGDNDTRSSMQTHSAANISRGGDSSTQCHHSEAPVPETAQPLIPEAQVQDGFEDHDAIPATLVPHSYNLARVAVDMVNEHSTLDNVKGSEIKSDTTSDSEGYTEQSEWPKGSQTSFTPIEQPEDTKKQHERPQVLQESDERLSELSYSQSLFWFSAAFADSPSSLNLTASFLLTGEIRVEALKRAVVALGQRHEALRTRFLAQDGRPVQVIMQSTALRLEHHTIQHDTEVSEHVNAIHHDVYDLQGGMTVRLALLSLSSNRHFFIVGVHHLAMDGQSFFPLMQDLLEHYTNRHDGVVGRQYADFSDELRTVSSSGGFDDELAFWKSELADMSPTLPILRTSPLTSRPTLQAYGNRQLDVKVGTNTKALIQVLCRSCGATPFHFYLAVLRVLLYRLTGSEDFSIGIGDANRTEDQMGSIGNFVNLLPLVFHTKGSAQFDAMLGETRSKVLAALANSRVPFQLLLQE